MLKNVILRLLEMLVVMHVFEHGGFWNASGIRCTSGLRVLTEFTHSKMAVAKVVNEYAHLEPAGDAHAIRSRVGANTVHVVVLELPLVHVPVLVHINATAVHFIAHPLALPAHITQHN